MSYDPREQELVLRIFIGLLRRVTRDGGRKRELGEKPCWWKDPSHEAAMFSHLNAYYHGVKEDKDSGAHPLVHLAWRALAIAWQESNPGMTPIGNIAESNPQGTPPFTVVSTDGYGIVTGRFTT